MDCVGRTLVADRAVAARAEAGLALGNDALDRLTAAAEQTAKERIAWESVSRGTDFDV
jgi:hypothetical protein